MALALASLVDPISLPPNPNHGDLRLAAPLPTRSFHGLLSSLPDADRASMAGLSDNDLRAWSAAKADDYRRLALALLSIYNAIAPIHRLPFELLSKVFKLCWSNRDSFRIGHVCRQWRSVLLDTSGFWANAVRREKFREGDCSTGYLGAMLERSMPQVIAPSFHNFSQRLFPYLAPHVDRIGALTVSLGSHKELVDLWSCLNSGMHSLRTLTITLLHHPRWMAAPRTLDGNLHLSPTSLPRLTRVTAPGRFLQYFAIPSLRHITLQNAQGEHIYNHRLHNDEYFRTALAVCAPNLESLALCNVSPLGGFEAVPLSLPALRKLVIEDTGRPCARMLSRVVLPTTAQIQVEVTDDASLSDTVPLDASAIQTALSATNCVGILRVPSALAILCSAGTETETALLTVSFRATEPRTGTGPRLATDDLVRFFRHKPGAPVVIVMLGELDSRDVPAIDLRAFPGLLGLVARGPMGHHVLTQLARTDCNDDGDGHGAAHGVPSRRPICPELATLNLEFAFPFNVDLERPEDSDEPGPAPTVTQMGTRGAAAIEAHFRPLCAELECVLPEREKMGTRLSRLGLGCPDPRRRPASEGERALGLEPWSAILERLEKLVDVPVSFFTIW